MKKTIRSKLVIISAFLIIIIGSISLLPSSNINNYTPKNSSQEKETIEEPTDTENNSNAQKENTYDIKYYQEKYNNKDIKGILEIPDLLKIIITQTTDNEYYLNHSYTKEKDIKGNPFIDYRIKEKSNQINIYGHNSRTYDIPFRKLEKLLEKDYFNQNEYIYYHTENHLEKYQILSIKGIKAGDKEHMKLVPSGKEFINHIDTLLKESIYQRNLSYDENSKILILQTCSYDSKYAYYIVIALAVQEV